MRLEGTLDAFGLPDILQLLAFTRKTGALRLVASSAAGVVHVRDGAICAASADVTRQALARRVVGSGLVGDEALQAAVRSATSSGRGVVAALLAAGALDVATVLPLAGEQTVDAVGELLRWGSGEFSFRVDETDAEGLPLELAVDEVVAEGQRRLAVWAELTAVIPTPDVALALAVAPPDDVACTREEWGLLALVDGTRSVREIVTLLGRSEFAVMRSLAALVSRGLLVVPGAAGPGGGFAELERRQALLAELEVDATATPALVAAPIPEQVVSEIRDPLDNPAVRGTSEPELLAPMAPSVPVATAGHNVRVTVVDGANALAADPELDLAPTPVDQALPRPALTLAVGPRDAPITRSLLLRIPALR